LEGIKGPRRHLGWQLEVFNLKDNAPEAGNALDNKVTAGYDAVIIPYLGMKGFENADVNNFRIQSFTACLASDGRYPPR